MAYKLRAMQQIGTSWIFVLIYLGSLLVCMLLTVIGVYVADCGDHVIEAIGYIGYTLLQIITVVMLLSMRQNSLENYKRLPIWIVTIGSLFQMSMYGLLSYQAIYLHMTDEKDVTDKWERIIRSLYLVGIFSPLIYWIFCYFLISRLNEKIRNRSNPTFLSTQDEAEIDDHDHEARVNHSGGDISSPTYYEDLRTDYKRPNRAENGIKVNTAALLSPTENTEKSGF